MTLIKCEKCGSSYEYDIEGGQTSDCNCPREAIKDPMINKPPHYNKHPSGVECIDVTQHLNFCMGNAVKYIWRADLKGDPIADLKKAAWYIEKELERREREQS